MVGGARAWLQRTVPRPPGEIHLYISGEAVGFAGARCVWAKGIGGKGGLYVHKTRR